MAQVNHIHKKFDSLILPEESMDLREAHSAIYNSSNIMAANIVSPRDDWTGIKTTYDINGIAPKFLEIIS